MDSPLPPDPYNALGVTKDADTAVIKSTYRKLVLKCHPDKFTDETIKAQKVEEFHKIQQAYEILVDEDRRSKYDAQIRLAELRREALERAQGNGSNRGVRVEIRTTGYDVRTAAPSSAAFPTRGSTRPHPTERRPSRGYDEHDRYYEESRGSNRKESTEYVRKSTKEREREKKDNDRSRAERKKEQSKNKRKDHSAKYAPTVEEDESDNYDRKRFEKEVNRRLAEKEEAERKRSNDRIRYAAEAEERRRKTEEDRARKVDSSPKKEREYEYKYQSLENEARDYIGSSRSTHDVRRSSARPKTTRNFSSIGRGEHRGSYPEIMEFPERKPPTLRPSDSSPANIRLPRSNTYQPEPTPRREGLSPPPAPFKRAETMPSPAEQDPPRRREGGRQRSSEDVGGHRDSGYSSPGTPEAQYSKGPSSTTYVYSRGPHGAGSVAPDDQYRTVLREPERERRLRKSPSPMRNRDRDRERDRDYAGPSVRIMPPTPTTRTYTYSYPDATPVSSRPAETRRPSMAPRAPGLTRAATSMASAMASATDPERRTSVDDRANRPLFREVSYSKKHDFSDIQFAQGMAQPSERRGRHRDRDHDMASFRPSMPRREATFA